MTDWKTPLREAEWREQRLRVKSAAALELLDAVNELSDEDLMSFHGVFEMLAALREVPGARFMVYPKKRDAAKARGQTDTPENRVIPVIEPQRKG